MTYNEDKKQFECFWRTETEHLEGVLTAYSEDEIHLESSTIDNHKLLINNYIKENSILKFNGKKQDLAVSIIEVNFSEITIHFAPIRCTRKLKTIEMENRWLIDKFPNQQNMLQINYKGQMYSMLLNSVKIYEKLIIEK